MGFQTFVIGRHRDADLRLDEEGTLGVSRLHAEVTVTDDRRCYLVDRNSTYGTQVLGPNGWQAHRQGYVDAAAKVRFGECEGTLAALLGGRARQPRIEVAYEPLSIRPRRNLGTGEVEF